MRQHRIGLASSAHLRPVVADGIEPSRRRAPGAVDRKLEQAGPPVPAVNAASHRSQTSLPFCTWSDADGPLAAFRKLLGDVTDPAGFHHVAPDESMRAGFALPILDEPNGWGANVAEPAAGIASSSQG